MSEPITVRPVERGDVGPRFFAALEALAPVGLTANEAWAVLAGRELCSAGRTYVAVVGAEVAGTASLTFERKLIHRAGLVGRIEDVAVHPDSRRRGVGTALVRHLAEVARGCGCYKCLLTCAAELAPFYARAGFRRHDDCLRLDLGEDK